MCVYLYLYITHLFSSSKCQPCSAEEEEEETGGAGAVEDFYEPLYWAEPSLAASHTEQKLSPNTFSQNNCIVLFYTKYKVYT